MKTAQGSTVIANGTLVDGRGGAPIKDAVAWMKDPAAPLPSGADKAAKQWLQDDK